MAPFFKPSRFLTRDKSSRQLGPTCSHVISTRSLRQPARQTALIIALSYHDSTQVELRNAHLDARHLAQCLVDQGFQRANVTLLLDDGTEPMRLTAENILSTIKCFVKGAECGDDLVFAFIGHAGQIDDRNGDEADGKDEVLIAVDGKHIIDDELHEALVQDLPSGTQLTILMDCCNSGTSVDLPFLIECGANGRLTPPSVEAPTYRWCDKTNGLGCVHNNGAKVVCLSACRDGETAWDFSKRSSYTLVDFFVDIMYRTHNKPMTFEALLQRLDHRFEEVSRRCKAAHVTHERQHPQLSSNYHLNPNQVFKLIRNAERHVAPDTYTAYMEKLMRLMGRYRISVRR